MEEFAKGFAEGTAEARAELQPQVLEGKAALEGLKQRLVLEQETIRARDQALIHEMDKFKTADAAREQVLEAQSAAEARCQLAKAEATSLKKRALCLETDKSVAEGRLEVAEAALQQGEARLQELEEALRDVRREAKV